MAVSRVGVVAAAVVVTLAVLSVPIVLRMGWQPTASPGELAPVAAAAPSAGAQVVAEPRAAVAASQPQAAAAAPAPQAQPTTQPSISVAAEGVVTMKPDIVRMTLGVDVFDQSLSQAQADAAQQMNAVIDKLKGMGIAEDDIQTVSYTVSPQYDYPNNGGGPILRGYRVVNLVSVTIRDISKTGQIVDAVVGAGATTIHGLVFDVNDPTPAKDQARTQAMQSAKHKADQLAAAAGVAVGKPLYIAENDVTSGPPVPLAAPAAREAAGAVAAPPPVQPGTLEIRTTVSVVYAIQ